MTIHQAISTLRDARDRHRDEYAKLNRIWREVLDLLGYVLDLKPVDLHRLRMHCGIFTGDIPWQFWHAADQYDAAAYATQLRYPQLVQGLPAELMYGEPANPYLARPMGVDYQGHILNPNVARFQSLISNLYLTGLWDDLALDRPSDEPARIVEIGPGYGGLAEFFLRARQRAVHFVALDFPEILAFALGQVSAIHPDALVVVATTPEDLAAAPADKSTLFLVPCFDADALAGLPIIDFAFNTTGFQEMNTTNVVRYLDLIMPRLTRPFYSDNIDRHHLNTEQSEPLSTTFKRYGGIWPPADVYDATIMENNWNWFYSSFFFGRADGLSALKKQIRVYFGPGKTGSVVDYKEEGFTLVG